MAMIGVPLILLQDPTRDHVVVSIAIVLIGAIAIFLGVRVLKNLSHEYRYEEGEDGSKDFR